MPAVTIGDSAMLWDQGASTSLMPPDHHEETGREHADSEQPAQQRLPWLREEAWQDADADMQMLPIADDSGQERQHDHQKDGQRLRPRRRAVEHVAGEDAVGYD